MVQGLTRRQKEILAYIQRYYQEQGVSPTLREIQAHLGLASVSTVARHVDLLREAGRISSKRGRRSLVEDPPAIAPPVEDPAANTVPFLGFFDPNYGIETLPIPQSFTIPPGQEIETRKAYALKVRGEGLFEENILDGDILIIEAGNELEPGYPTLLREGTEWWLRRCYPTGEYLSMESLTGQGAPIVRAANRIEVLGRLVGLWRLYDF